MNTFLLTVASPDGNLFQGQVERLTLRGIEGDLAILAGHTPFITGVQPGELRIYQDNGKVRTAQTEGGLLSVSKERVTLLSGTIHWNE